MLVWSFFWLFKGKWPPVDEFGNTFGDDRKAERDVANTDLADGLFGVLWCLKGDLDYFAKSWKIRGKNILRSYLYNS